MSTWWCPWSKKVPCSALVRCPNALLIGLVKWRFLLNDNDIGLLYFDSLSSVIRMLRIKECQQAGRIKKGSWSVLCYIAWDALYGNTSLEEGNIIGFSSCFFPLAASAFGSTQLHCVMKPHGAFMKSQSSCNNRQTLYVEHDNNKCRIALQLSNDFLWGSGAANVISSGLIFQQSQSAEDNGSLPRPHLMFKQVLNVLLCPMNTVPSSITEN